MVLLNLRNELQKKLEIVIPEQRLTISQEPKTMNTQAVFPTNKQTPNDAELKVLETLANKYFSKESVSNVTIDIFSDRITCGFCQEVGIRIRYPGTTIPWAVDHPNINKSQFKMDGFPLYVGETLSDAKPLLSALEQVSLQNGCIQ